MSIAEHLDRCGFWVEFNALVATELMTAGIKLENNALSRAFFYLRRGDQFVFCVPVNCLLHAKSDGLKITILFQLYDDMGIELVCPDGETFVLMNGQLRLCAKLSVLSDDPFQSQNWLFLKEFGTKMEMFTITEPLRPMFPIEMNRNARQTWINRIEAQNRAYFTETKDLSLMAYSWNIAEHPPEEADRESAKWIFEQGVDLVCIALQELDFTATAVIFGGSRMFQPWLDFFTGIGGPCGYELVRGDSLGSVFLALFKKSDMIINVSEKGVIPLRLGVNGWAANKAALVFHASIGQMNFGFVSVHLSAHEEYLQRRNEEMAEITALLDSLNLDYAIVTGDLNYRVELPYQIAVDQLASGNADFLARHDQLARYLTTSEFKEPKITFKPTYRFDAGSDVYDTSKKQRVPSWTDRVLIRTSKPRMSVGLTDTLFFESDIIRHIDLDMDFQGESNFSLDESGTAWPTPPECVVYTSRQDVRLSDHRPVYAIYKFKVPIVNEERYKQLEDVRNRKYDDIVAMSVPRCEVTPQAFRISDTTEVVLENVSCAICSWKAGDCPNVTIEPMKGLVMPGHKATLRVTVREEFDGVEVVLLDVERGPPVVFEFWQKEPVQ